MKFEELPVKGREYCIIFSERVNGLMQELRDVIKIVKNAVDYIELKEVSRDFYFIISDPDLNTNSGRTSFKVSWFPTKDISYEAMVERMEGDQTVQCFRNWADIIRRLDDTKKRRDELLKMFNHEESYIPFEEVEDDDKLISAEHQKSIGAALLLLQNSLAENKEKYPVEDIIQDVTALQQNLALLPERVIKQMGQNVMKKIVDLGNDAVKDIIKDGMKDFIKYLFLGEAARQLLAHLHLLG